MSLPSMLKSIEDTQLYRKIVRVNPDWYYVPSSEGQICYKVMVSEDGREYCSCEQYARNMKSDSILKCKHVMYDWRFTADSHYQCNPQLL